VLRWGGAGVIVGPGAYSTCQGWTPLQN